MPELRDKTAGPASMYRRVPTSDARRRTYTITMSLQPGYRPAGTLRSVDQAIARHQDWMADRIDRGLPYLTGLFHRPLLSYAWPRPEHGEPGRAVERALVFTGEVSVLYAADVPDGDVEDMLDELGGWLAAALGQVRVYVTYLDQAWVLEASDG